MRWKLWLVPAALYALFVIWYTDFKGPLSNHEIDTFIATMRTNGTSAEQLERLETFLRQDTGRQFLMVNNIDMNENPPSVDGAAPNENADQLMARYMEHMLPALLSRACHPVVMGNAIFTAMDVVGIEGAEQWTSAALFRYRSRRSFVDIVSNPAFAGKHHFKTAALDKTIAYPIETSLYLGDPRLLLALVMLTVTALVDAFVLSRKRG
ncbi:MAG: hypothetical protein AB8B81_05110 [Halioglobus sp.]